MLQCTTAGPYNAIPSTLLGVSSVCDFGPDLVGIHSLSLRLAIELQHALPRFAEVLKRSVRLEDTIALLFSLSLPFGKEFLVPSMAFSTANALDIVCRLDRDNTQKQKAESCNWPASGQTP